MNNDWHQPSRLGKRHAESTVERLELFIQRYGSAPQLPRRRDQLAALRERSQRREQAITAYETARESGDVQAGWGGRQLVACPELAETTRLPLTVTGVANGQLLLTDSSLTATADDEAE